jgi:hypothetical protein
MTDRKGVGLPNYGSRSVTPLREPADPLMDAPMTRQEAFNRSSFSHFINGPRGRVFRVLAGAAFLIVGLVFRHHPLGVLSMLWSILPLTAGIFDVCYISVALGGPFSGALIRARYWNG